MDGLEDTLKEALFQEFPPIPTEAWEAKIQEDLRGTSYEEALVWEPWDGFTVAPYYRAEDLKDVRLAPLQGRERGLWQIRQDILQDDLAEANRLAREALHGGADALGFSLGVGGEAGHGVSIQSADDLDRLLDAIDLGTVPLHLTTNRAAEAVGAMWADVAERRGVAAEQLQGSLTFGGPETVSQNSADVRAAMDEAAALARWAAAEVPRLRVLSVDVRPYRQANPVVQIAKALAQVSAYLAQLTERGLAVDHVSGQIHLAVSVGASFLMEIAKLRALRPLVQRVVSVYAEGENSLQPAPITAFTSDLTSSEADIHLNLVHGTAAAAAALIGGCDVLAVHPFDAALGSPTDAAYRLARGTGLILRHEAHFGTTPDPAAGAYHIEVLTDKLARAAWDAFREFEKGGKGERKNGGEGGRG